MPSTVIEISDFNLDNTIVPVADGEYVSDNGIVRSEFYELGNRVVFDRKGRKVSWTPSAMKYVDADGIEDMLFTVQDVPLETKANYARYNRAMPDVDDWFTQENDRLKHSILLQGFQRDPMPWLTGPIDFVFGGRLEFDADLRVRVDDFIVVGGFETDGAIELLDENGAVIFTLPPIVAYDSNIPERSTTGGKYRVTSNEGGVLAFDIVVANEWIADVGRVYPIIIDPTVITTGMFDFSYRDRRTVTLPNGTRVVGMRNGSAIYLYKSTDGGNTWSQLWTLSGADFNGFSMDARADSTITVLFVSTIGTARTLRHININMSGTVTNQSDIESGTSHSGSGVAVVVGSDGAIYVAYAWYNGTYASFNIKYTKSTNNGVTWSTPVWLSTDSNSNISNLDPVIDLSGGNPIVAWRFGGNDASGWYDRIYVSVWNGSVWSSKSLTGSGNNGEDYGRPSLVIKRSGSNVGRAFVAFHIQRSSGSTNLYCYMSNDGFATYSQVAGSISGSSSSDQKANPTLTEVPGIGDIYLFYHSGTTAILQAICPDNTAAFGASTNFFTGTSITSVASDQHGNFSSFGVSWIDSGGVKYQGLAFNVAPNAPILTPKASFDATTAQTLEWTFSDGNPTDTQSAWQVLIKRASDGALIYDYGKVASTLSAANIAAGFLANGVQYQWQCRTWDNNDVAGPYSALSTFWTSAKPTVLITSPATDGEIVTSSDVTVTWVYSDPEGAAQYGYRIVLTDNADVGLWDSGTVLNASLRQRTIPITLANNTTYKIKMTVWDAQVIASAVAVRTFKASFTPPATPTIALTANVGYIGVQVTNPVPSGTQPTVSYNAVYRREAGEVLWTRIATGVVSGGSYKDYHVASGITYEYMVRALGSNSATSDSATASKTITLAGVWLHDVNQPSTLKNFPFDGLGRNRRWEPEVTLHQFAGRDRPVAEFGMGAEDRITATLEIVKGSPDYHALVDLIRRRTTLCYRDGRGRKLFGIVKQFPENDVAYGYSVTLEIFETDYSEEV